MTGPRALQKLLTWLSPAFPVGAFAWSGGLESAIADGSVNDSAATQIWVEGGLRHGGARTDAILAAAAWRASADRETLGELADLALALIPAAERRAETLAVGEAFVRAVRAWPSAVFERLPEPCPYPIALGAVAAAQDVPLLDTLLAFVSAQLAGQVSVAVRLVPIGQVDGVAILAGLEPLVAELAEAAASAGLEDIGAIGYATDIAQMRHETLETRIFRS